MAVARSRVLALDTIAPALGAMGYALLRPTPDTLEFRRDDRVWVAIDLEPDDQGMTSMTIRGRAPLLVRRRFARLSLS